MLPNLIDLIIIFGKLGDGDPSAVYCPHEMRAFLLLFCFVMDLSVYLFLISLYILEIFIVFEHLVCLIVGIAGDIF